MSVWFVQNSQDEIGPLKPSDLLEMVRVGKVTPETMIRKDDSSWFEASQVGGLFEAAMRPTIEYFCTGCDHPVSEPPSLCEYCGRELYKARTRIIENTIVSKSEGNSLGNSGQSVQRWLSKVRKK